MAWTVRLSREAEKQFHKLSHDCQEFILKYLLEMRDDPFRGDVEPLKGKQWKGRYRKVAGRSRLIFVPRHHDQIVEIAAILLRNEKTYR